MFFCEECGSKLEEGSKFCEECGTTVENISDPNKTASSSPKQTTKVVLTKTQKIVLGMAVGLGVMSFAGYKIGENVFSQENQKENLIEVLSSNDPEALAGILKTDDPNFEIDAETIAPFVTYLEENPNYLNSLVSELQYSDTYDMLEIRENGAHFLFYDNFELVITPVYATVYTNAKGAKISSNEVELLTSDSDEFYKEIGPLAPGDYDFNVEGVINDSTLTRTENVSLLHSDFITDIDLILQGTYFDVYSDLADATVYVDDKEIGTLTNGEGQFGPIQVELGQTLHVSKSFGDDVISSDKVDLSDYDDTYYFDDLVVADEYDLNDVIYTMYNTASSLTRYYNDSDVEYYATLFSPDGSAYEEQHKQFLAFAKDIYDNEDMDDVSFEVELKEYEQTGMYTFDVHYEVTYVSSFDYRVYRNNKIRHYKKDMTIEYVPTNNPYRDYDAFITDISNEELLYEEGGEDN
ncbi:zinc ribbon domain-containing protein [Alkalibacterium sp. f15]|uniref:zinc ribbon domain-containing protein n=1 Tax=Alkalibacterium sp. f15 TaxID=3414029 RepID=UPI003BF83A5F